MPANVSENIKKLLEESISEETVHINIAEYLNRVLIGFYSTIENSNQQGGAAARIKQGKLKKKGAKKGIPDIIIHYFKDLVIRLPHAGITETITIPATLYLEVKRVGEDARPSQVSLHEELAKWKVLVEVVHNIDEVRAALKKHNVPTKEIYL